jgi:peptidyl-prolyl cis-trans isomerase A (cyclophilin A)
MKKLFAVMCLVVVLSGVNSFAAEKKAVKPALPIVEIKTSLGNIKLELYPKKAPLTVKNFLMYVKKKSYNGTVFHRVIAGFMIQGGGFNKDLEKTAVEKPVKNEADNGLSNKLGTIAMARTMIVNSATNQFFINLKNNSFLDHQSERSFGYCVFGKIISGMDVLDKIAQVKTTSKNRYSDVPETPVIIKEIVKVN